MYLIVQFSVYKLSTVKCNEVQTFLIVWLTDTCFNSFVWRVHLKRNEFFWFKHDQYWLKNEQFLQLLKSFFCFLSSHKQYVLSHKIRKWRDDSEVFLYKASIEVREF